MKSYIITCSILIILVSFISFQLDNDKFMRSQEYHKMTADSCADAAALYYDFENYSEGVKVFNRIEGNKAVKYLLKENLNLNDNFTSKDSFFGDTYDYYVYYFDGNGEMTTYKNDALLSKTVQVGFPYLFEENLTGYKQMIYAATIVVTIDAGQADYKISIIKDPELIRTSGYEYWQN